MKLDDLKNLASSENLSNIKEKVEDVAETVAEKAEAIGRSVNIDAIKGVAAKVEESARKVRHAMSNYPGAAVDSADNDKANECLEKQDTRILNNNPRNSDMEV